MKVGKAFPSKYIKVDDLNESDLVVTINKVMIEEIGQGDEKQEKLIVFFREIDKGMVCNKTNARTIEKLYGDETDEWIGKRITLWPNHDVQFGSELVSAIRVRAKAPSQNGTGPEKPEAFYSNEVATGQTESLIRKLKETYKYPDVLLNGYLDFCGKTTLSSLTQAEATKLIDMIEKHAEHQMKGTKAK